MSHVGIVKYSKEPEVTGRALTFHSWLILNVCYLEICVPLQLEKRLPSFLKVG